jgi:hypothetical protein
MKRKFHCSRRALEIMEDRGKESTAIFSFIKGGIHYGNSA